MRPSPTGNSSAGPAARSLSPGPLRGESPHLWARPFSVLVGPCDPSSEPTPGGMRLSPHFDHQSVVPFDRRSFLSLTGAAMVAGSRLSRTPADPLPASDSISEVGEALESLEESWHQLVRTDYLLGPRYALPGVRQQLGAIESILPSVRRPARERAVRLASWYGELAAWLHEDAGDMNSAVYWTGRAMEWAHEADDDVMVAWTLYRRSQQAATTGDTAQALGLAYAAQHRDDRLPSPMRAAIRVQQACAHAAEGNDIATWHLLDEALEWAASDDIGEARDGHGSFCTLEFIELQRASCWLMLGNANRAAELFRRNLPALAPVYFKNRGSAQSRLATAYAIQGDAAQAATTANQALDVALACGSGRILNELSALSESLSHHAKIPDVAALLERLSQSVPC
jgi:hypothetical protein